MNEPVLLLDRVTAGYDGVAAIRDVTISVNRGEVVALLGANGAGKTTTLKAVSGLLRPMTGDVHISSVSLDGYAPAARARLGIAHVPEGRGVFAGLTVAEHLSLGCRGERLDAAAVYAHFPALSKLRNRRTGLLSGGEQQMLAVGQALARRPQILLLDELSLGLAPVIVEALLPVVREFAKTTACGVLLVEQHIELALKAADRAYVLSHGEITLERPAADLARDRELILASYLGDTAAATS